MIICAVFVLVDPYHGQFFSDKPIEESDCDQNAEYKCPVRPWHLKKKISQLSKSILPSYLSGLDGNPYSFPSACLKVTRSGIIGFSYI